MCMKARKDIEMRDLREREIDILAASAMWDEIPGEACGECRMGCTVTGERVEGVMTPHDYGVDVRMTLPFAAERQYFQTVSFFNRRPRIPMLDPKTGAATPACIGKAREMLVEMYSDIVWLRMCSDRIREQYGRYLREWRAGRPAEEARAAGEKAVVRELSARSGELKRMFRSGLISQHDYVERRKPVHDMIVEHLARAVVRDPFPDYFRQEYAGCLYLHDPREVLTLIARGGTRTP